MSFDCHSKWRRADEPNGNWYYRKWEPHGTDRAAQSALNVMKRDQCCKSKYKMHCHSCDKPIYQGDITRVFKTDQNLCLCDMGKNRCICRPQSGPNRGFGIASRFVLCQLFLLRKYIGIWTVVGIS